MAAPLLAVHGGAGVIDRTTGGRLAEARDGLHAALRAGGILLEQGGTAVDAVDAAVRTLEDHPCFNAGRGSVLTREGEVEMDAAIMDGRSGAAGAVASLSGIRHPIHAARVVMERSPHVLLAGPGALRFAIAHGVETAERSWLVTDRAVTDLARLMAGTTSSTPPAGTGTVGAVALDAAGGLAAATSTGGVTGKLPGRVGDSPIIGAGTWADQRCAISATGHGESFLRSVFAHALASAIAAGVEPGMAAEQGLARVMELGGSGGCILVHRTAGIRFRQHRDMFRGWWDTAGQGVAIFSDE